MPGEVKGKGAVSRKLKEPNYDSFASSVLLCTGIWVMFSLPWDVYIEHISKHGSVGNMMGRKFQNH